MVLLSFIAAFRELSYNDTELCSCELDVHMMDDGYVVALY